MGTLIEKSPEAEPGVRNLSYFGIFFFFPFFKPVSTHGVKTPN